MNALLGIAFSLLLPQLTHTAPISPPYADDGMSASIGCVQLCQASGEDDRQRDLEQPDAQQRDMEIGDVGRRQDELEQGNQRQRQLEAPDQRQRDLDTPGAGDQGNGDQGDDGDQE